MTETHRIAPLRWRRKRLLRVLEAAEVITRRRCDIFIPPFTCITEDDGMEPWNPCDPCLLAQAGVSVPDAEKAIDTESSADV